MSRETPAAVNQISNNHSISLLRGGCNYVGNRGAAEPQAGETALLLPALVEVLYDLRAILATEFGRVRPHQPAPQMQGGQVHALSPLVSRAAWLQRVELCPEGA